MSTGQDGPRSVNTGPLVRSSEFVPPEWLDELETKGRLCSCLKAPLATNPHEIMLPAIRGLSGENVLVVATTVNRSSRTLPTNKRLEGGGLTLARRQLPIGHGGQARLR